MCSRYEEGLAKGLDDADIRKDVEAEYIRQELTTGDYCIAVKSGGERYITRFILRGE